MDLLVLTCGLLGTRVGFLGALGLVAGWIWLAFGLACGFTAPFGGVRWCHFALLFLLDLEYFGLF
jgi:hypothetical protein